VTFISAAHRRRSRPDDRRLRDPRNLCRTTGLCSAGVFRRVGLRHALSDIRHRISVDTAVYCGSFLILPREPISLDSGEGLTAVCRFGPYFANTANAFDLFAHKRVKYYLLYIHNNIVFYFILMYRMRCTYCVETMAESTQW